MKQNWHVGDKVKVGFVNDLLVVGDTKEGFVLSRGSQWYVFTPHRGLFKIEEAEANQILGNAARPRYIGPADTPTPEQEAEELAATQEIMRQLQPGAEEAAMPEAGGGAPAVTPTTAESAPPPQDDLTGMLGEPPPEAATVADEAHGGGGDTDVDVSPVPQDAGAPGSEWGLDLPVAHEVPSAETVQESKPSRGGGGINRQLKQIIRMAGHHVGKQLGMPELGDAAALIPDLLEQIGGQNEAGSTGGSSEGVEGNTSLQTTLERLMDTINRLIDAMGGQSRSPGIQADGSFVPSLTSAAGAMGGAPSANGQSAASSGGGQSTDATLQIVMTILRMMLLAAA